LRRLAITFSTAVAYGYLTTNPARGVKFPQRGPKEKPTIIAGGSFAKLLEQIDEHHRTMVRLIAANRTSDRGIAGPSMVGTGP
jgi:hypothetical protein